MKNSTSFKKGHTLSLESRMKISRANTGRKFSEETKRKIGDKKKGKSTWIKGKTHTELARKKIGDAHRGEKSNWWKGGVSDEDCKNRHMGSRYENWRKKVFMRDNFTCQMCGLKGGNKEAHHKKSWKNFPALRYHVKNGVTLCKKPCHLKANREQKLSENNGDDRRI